MTTECLQLETKMNKAQRKYAGSENSRELQNDYVLARKTYKNKIKEWKKNIKNKILEKWAAVNSGKDFWRTINTFKKRHYAENCIQPDEWAHFYNNLLRLR